MKLYEAKNIITEVFENPFDKEKFSYFIRNLLKNIHPAEFIRSGYNIPKAFEDFIASYERLGKYEDEEGNLIDVLIVKLKRDHSIDYARSTQRNFIRWYLNEKGKDAALVAFHTEKSSEWRFSFIKMQYSLEKKADELTPAKRSSFMVGESGKSHTAQRQLVDLLKNDHAPYLSDIEDAFSIEAVSNEFYEKYKTLLFNLVDEIEKIIKKDKTVKEEFESKNISILNFSKKLLGQIVFLYFLQKKGWLGLEEKGKYGEGDKSFLRSLFNKTKPSENFFNDYLEYLFYDALSNKRVTDYYDRFKTRIPFLNGGLFDPIAFYDWQKTDIVIPNNLFSNRKGDEEGNGILDVFDLYNFTVKEDEPLETEVAIDPEMLGKVFERMLDVTERKSKGAFYTPREIVHYMAHQSLLYFLKTELQNENVPKEDLENFIHYGEHIIDKDIAIEEGKLKQTANKQQIPESIRQNADAIDRALEKIKICDPAVGSGAFPVGIMNEIVKLRKLLTPFLIKERTDERSAYCFKSNAIQNSIYGVDIDAGGVEIAKLRLWLSMVVDENRIDTIEPLPNLDYKIVKGNSLINMPENSFRDVNLEMEIENLINSYYPITDKDRKQEQKEIIDQKINQLLKSASEYTSYEIDFDFKLLFHEVFNQNGGFDIVIGNPPYLGEKGHKELFQRIRLTDFGKKYYKRRMDLFYYFIHKGIDLLNSTGVLAFITTDYYPTATYANILRNDLRKRTSCLRFIDFNDFKIFDSAKGQHNMISIIQKGKNDVLCDIASIDRQGSYDKSHLRIILEKRDNETHYFTKKQEELFEGNDAYLRILTNNGEENDLDTVLDKILKQSYHRIGNILNLDQGIVSGADKVTNKIIENYPDLILIKGEGIFILTKEEVDDLKLTEDQRLKFIKPIYKNSNLKKWHIQKSKELFVIYLKDEGESIRLPMSLQTHFEKFKPILVDKKKNCFKNAWLKKIVKPWLDRGNYFVLFYPRDKAIFEQPKIVNSRRSRSNIFAYENQSYYEQSDIVIGTLKPEMANKFDIKFILGLLNSTTFFTWLYFKGKRKGEHLELYQKPLSEIPIKEVMKNDQKPFVNIVDYIIFLKTQSNENMSFYFEQLIDGLVYEVYFEKEIKQAGCDILTYLYDLPEIRDEMPDEEKIKIITKVFNNLYDKESLVRKNLFFMDSVEEVDIIKKSLKK